jgi:CheY-like chemotaxis protein
MRSSDKFHILSSVQTNLQNKDTLDEESDAENTPAGQKIKKVLIVDDNKIAADGLVQLFKAMGWEAQALYSGQQLLALLPEQAAAIAFIDIGMPEMDGYEVIREARARGFSLPAVALTGYGQMEDKEQALAAGFTAHLTKPAGIEDFKRILLELRLTL